MLHQDMQQASAQLRRLALASSFVAANLPRVAAQGFFKLLLGGQTKAGEVGDEHVAQCAAGEQRQLRQGKIAQQRAVVDGAEVEAGAKSIEEVGGHGRRVFDSRLELRLAVLAHERIRIFALGQKGKAQLAAFRERGKRRVHGFPSRIAASRVAVEAAGHEIDAAAEQLVEVRRADGGAQRCHRVVHAVLGERQNVHVAFNHDYAVEALRRLPGLVQAIEFASLAEVRRVGGVEVLGGVRGCRAEDAAAEADHAAAGVADGEDDAVAKAVVGSAALVSRHKTGGDEFSFAERAKCGLQAIPAGRGEADAEAPDHRGAEAPLRQIRVRLGAVRALAKPLLVAPRRGFEGVVGAAFDLRPSRAFARDLQAGGVRQGLDRFRKGKAVDLHEKAQHRAVGAAAEAVVAVRVDVERGRLLLMEWTQPGVAVAGFAQLHATADDFHRVDAFKQPVDERLRNQAGHRWQA